MSDVSASVWKPASTNKVNFDVVVLLFFVPQTVENFHAQYDDIFDKNNDTTSEGEDENLILRSFTDDPEIPLRQIKVSAHIFISTGCRLG